jgi:cytochrome c oxidase assembly protein subunit 15
MIHRLLQFLVALTFILLFAGGLVTSTDSGLAVPDWPLSFGGLFPPMVGGIRFEHTHRIIASTVGLLTLVITIWIGKTETRPAVRRLAIAALGAVVLQGILGGMTVLHQLPAPVSIVHASLGPIFFSMVVALAVTVKNPSFGTPPRNDLSLIVIPAIFIQILLGAVVRHTDRALWVHIVWAFVVFAIVGFLVSKLWSRTALFLGFLVILEFFLGIGAFIFTRIQGVESHTARVLLPTLHQTLGALILATTVTLALKGKPCETAS